MKLRSVLMGAASLACASGSWAQNAPAAPEQPAAALRELFPGVRADLKSKVVEFDGEVPIDCHDPKTPHVYLEVFVCTSDTKEHEALAMTKAKPSHIHAALLACGYAPGKPGSWTWDAQAKKLKTHPPEGDALDVFIAYSDAQGKEIEARASDWVVSTRGKRFEPAEPGKPGWWVFAGSTTATRAGREVYDADGTGTLIGLATFGMETIAWRGVISHEASFEEPEWIADAKHVPKFGTKVVIRIKPAAPAIAPPEPAPDAPKR